MAFYRDNSFKQPNLDYETCKQIYRVSTIAKRVVEALVNFSMSADREITVQTAPPEAIERFNKMALELQQEDIIKSTLYNSRIYGVGGLFVALRNKEDDKEDYETKPCFDDADKFDFKFITLDPLNMSGTRIEQDPLSFNFLEFIDYKVGTIATNKKRLLITTALKPLYLDNFSTLIPFAPPSIFNNIYELLISYDRALEDIDSLLYKAGAIVHKYPAGSKLGGVKLDAIQQSQKILQQKNNGSIISITNDSSLENFPINSLSGLIETINKLENSITVGINDTPASILFDRSLSNGFSDGDKDKQTEVSLVKSFQQHKLKPLYELTDYYIMLKAWDNSFINEMKEIYSELQTKSNAEIFRTWVEDFTYEFGNLFPEPESVVQDINAKKLNNLKLAIELGANLSDVQEELNESEIFKNEMELDSANLGRLSESSEDITIDSNLIRIGGTTKKDRKNYTPMLDIFSDM